MPLKGLGRQAASSEEDTKILRDFVEQLGPLEILNYQLVAGTIVTGQAFVKIRHSLGRAYQGGIVTGASTSVTPVVVQTPNDARLGGTDIAQFVVVLASAAVAADHTVNVLVF
jgi:hypothetical protein